MEDAAFVGGSEAGADFAGELDGFILGEAADAAEERCEVLAVDVFHGEEVEAFDHAEVVDSADVGVADLAGYADFVSEADECGFAYVDGVEEF